MPNPDKTQGQKFGREIVDIAMSRHGTNIIRDEYPVTLKEIEDRIDRLIAELTPKRVLDFTKIEEALLVAFWDGFGSADKVKNAVKETIRQQLPDVEVRT